MDTVNIEMVLCLDLKIVAAVVDHLHYRHHYHYYFVAVAAVVVAGPVVVAVGANLDRNLSFDLVMADTGIDLWKYLSTKQMRKIYLFKTNIYRLKYKRKLKSIFFSSSLNYSPPIAH